MAYVLELPDIGEGVVEAEVQKWFVVEGDLVAEDQPLVEVMTDKATVVIPSPRRGRVVRRCWKEGQIAPVHSALIELELEVDEAGSATGGATAAPAAATAAAPKASSPRSVAPVAASPAPARPAGTRALAAPAVRALARELGLDLQAVAGSGPGGRVLRADVTAAANGHQVATATATPTPASTAPPPSTPTPTGRAALPDERIPLRGLRRVIAERMALSKRTAAHFTFVEQCDATALVRVKEEMAPAAAAEGVKLTFLPFVVKAVVAALQAHPKLNARLDEAAGEIVLHRRYDIGIASATEAGLLVPVVRGADGRSLLDLAREIERLSADARAGRARPADQGHSTFTLTSLGALGGLFATPVLNFPEVGILGVHRIRPTPVVRDGQVVVRQVMHLSVTSDHRVVDGHEAAAFCYEVIRYLEEPNLLFMRMV
jgi:pyruvate dehydrogenase E2 component (dihydrolipoamide acetyltransferase)